MPKFEQMGNARPTLDRKQAVDEYHEEQVKDHRPKYQRLADEWIEEGGQHEYWELRDVVEHLGERERELFALELIRARHASYIFESQDLFSSTDERILIDAALEAEEFDALASHADSFDQIKSRQLADLLAEKDGWEEIATHLARFHDLSAKFFDQLVKRGYGTDVAMNRYAFGADAGTDDYLLDRLLKQGKEVLRVAAGSLGDFTELTKAEPLLFLIEAGHGATVARDFRCTRLSQPVATALIEHGYAQDLAQNLALFTRLSSETARALVQGGHIVEVSYFLNQFDKLDVDLAQAFIDSGAIHQVLTHPDRFRADRKELALMMIRAGHAVGVFRAINASDSWRISFDIKQLASLCEQTHQIPALAEFVEERYLVNLDAGLAKKFVEAGCSRVVARRPEAFARLDWNELADAALLAGRATELTEAITQFYPERVAFSKNIGQRFVVAGLTGFVLRHSHLFESVDQKKMVNTLLNKRDYATIATNLSGLTRLDHQVAKMLIAHGFANLVAFSPQAFSEHSAIPALLAEEGKFKELVDNLQRWPDLKASIIHQLIERGYASAVARRVRYDALVLLDATAVNMLVERGEDILDGARAARLFREGADESKARQLCAAGGQAVVAKYLSLFHSLSLETAATLMKSGYSEQVAAHLKAFDANPKDIANLLLERRAYAVLALIADQVQVMDPNELILQLIRENDRHTITQQLSRFKNLSSRVAESMIEAGMAGLVTTHIVTFADYFTNTNTFCNKMALQMLRKVGGDIGNHLRNLRGLTNETAQAIFATGRADAVIKNLPAFERLRLEPKHLVGAINDWHSLNVLNKVDMKDAHKLELIGRVLDILPLSRYSRVRADIVAMFPQLNEKEIRGSMHDTIAKLEGLQARVTNEKYDPWLTDLEPLLLGAKERGTFFQHPDAKEGGYLVEFVKQYGMYNLPILFDTHMDVMTAEDWAGLSGATRRRLSSLGVELKAEGPIRGADKSRIIQSLQEVISVLRTEILQDRIPDLMQQQNNEIAFELLDILKGQTQWTRGDKPAGMVAMLMRTAKERPDRVKLPDGYEEMTFSVPLKAMKQEAKPDEPAQQPDQLIDKETVGMVADLAGLFEKGGSLLRPVEWWKAKQAEMLAQYQDEIAKITSNIDRGAAQERAIAAMVRRKKILEEVVKLIQSVTLDEAQQPAIGWYDLLTALVDVSARDAKRWLPIVKEVSAAHLSSIMPAGIKERVRELAEQRKSADPAVLKEQELLGWSSFFVDYLGEHYLHPDQAEHHTGHPPFNPPTLTTVTSLWNMSKGAPRHPLVTEANNYLSSAESGTKKTKRKLEITLVPAKGLLRVYSGDLGDACFTSKHADLAAGSFPGLTSFTFVTGRRTKQERLRGSVLVIETKNSEGKPVMLVRANNPQENLLGQVDADALLDEVMKAMRVLAKKRGIDIVAVPVDAASASCSNRAAVANYYQEKYLSHAALRLVNEPETNFNGYNNWDPHGHYPVRSITA